MIAQRMLCASALIILSTELHGTPLVSQMGGCESGNEIYVVDALSIKGMFFKRREPPTLYEVCLKNFGKDVDFRYQPKEKLEDFCKSFEERYVVARAMASTNSRKTTSAPNTQVTNTEQAQVKPVSQTRVKPTWTSIDDLKPNQSQAARLASGWVSTQSRDEELAPISTTTPALTSNPTFFDGPNILRMEDEDEEATRTLGRNLAAAGLWDQE